MTKREKRIHFMRLLDIANGRPPKIDEEYDKRWHEEKHRNFVIRQQAFGRIKLDDFEKPLVSGECREG